MNSIIGTVQKVCSSEDFLNRLDKIHNYEREESTSRRILSTFDDDEFLGGRLRRLGINLQRLNDVNFFQIVVIKSAKFHYISDDEFIELFSTIPEDRVMNLLDFLKKESNKNYEKYLKPSLEADVLGYDLTQDGEFNFTWMENSKEEKHRLFLSASQLVRENPDIPVELLVELLIT